MAIDKPLYVCCPICGKSTVKSKPCDGMEITCSKCGNQLRIIIGKSARVSVELVNETIPEQSFNSVAPRNVVLG